MQRNTKAPPQAPTIHRMKGELKLCDPEKLDHTKSMESWRIMKIMGEIVDGFALLDKYTLAATFFGSARCGFSDQTYLDAEELAARLARSNFAVITGGGPGIMEAANKGAHKVGGKSVGLSIKIPHEVINPYLTDHMQFNYFFTRRVMLDFASEVYIFFPGGFGTFDELFEILTLIQTRKIKRIPCILYGKEFWTPLIEYFKTTLLDKNNAIDRDDLDFFTLVDSVDEAYDVILAKVKC